MNPIVTIIIPTYQDWDRLELCVNALKEQSYPQEQFEVLVVNNHPGDKPPANFYLPPNVRILHENTPGSYAARNKGLEEAKGSIIGFTDADCIPDKDWIKNAVEHLLSHPDCSRIAGAVSVFAKTVKATMAENYDKLYAFRQKRYVVNSGTCVTANMFSYKSVFDAVGLFNSKQMSYGDLDWGRKAAEAGYKICLVENAIVKHPARDLAELIKKEKRLAGGREKGVVKYNTASALTRFVKEARPRVRGPYRFIAENAKGMSTTDRVSVLMIKLLLNYVRAYETMRLRLGKKPNRA